MNLPQVEASVVDLSKFATVVKLVAFHPFQSGVNALDNINAISEGLVHDDLRTFLDTNLPKEKKRTKMILGVADPRIASTINELFSIPCQHTGVVPELLRGKISKNKKRILFYFIFFLKGLRLHFPNLVKGLTDQNQNKAQLGLGHAYSRAKVKFNVNRVDNMIIQSIALLDQLDKDINTFAMRIRYK
jgi:RNA processing factor Prp31